MEALDYRMEDSIGFDFVKAKISWIIHSKGFNFEGCSKDSTEEVVVGVVSNPNFNSYLDTLKVFSPSLISWCSDSY